MHYVVFLYSVLFHALCSFLIFRPFPCIRLSIKTYTNSVFPQVELSATSHYTKIFWCRGIETKLAELMAPLLIVFLLPWIDLKVVSATFRLVYFLSQNESTCQTRKNVFYFASKALLVLEKIKFYNSTFSNFMKSSNAWA